VDVPARRVTGTAIIGGGIAGVALAHHLAVGGDRDVVVLERSGLASGSTGYSLGGVRQQFSSALEIELSKRGLAFWRSVEDRFDAACPFHEDGYLFVTGDDDLVGKMTQAAALQRSLGAGPIEILGPHELATLVPWLRTDGLLAGSWTPCDGRVNPTDGVNALAGAARRLGVRIELDFPVRAIRRDGAELVLTGPDEVRARRVVVAAGIWAPELCAPLGYRPAIRAMPLHYALTASPLPDDVRLPMTIDFDSGLCVHRQGRGLSAAMLIEDPPPEYGPDDMIEAFAEAAATRAPALADLQVQRTVTAAADLSADGHPYVGEFADSLWIIAGFGGHGTMHGEPVAAALAASLLGRPDPTFDLTPLDPHRTGGGGDEWMVAARKQRPTGQPGLT
jgi:sarcosine oxidase subunit beta